MNVEKIKQYIAAREAHFAMTRVAVGADVRAEFLAARLAAWEELETGLSDWGGVDRTKSRSDATAAEDEHVYLPLFVAQLGDVALAEAAWNVGMRPNGYPNERTPHEVLFDEIRSYAGYLRGRGDQLDRFRVMYGRLKGLPEGDTW